MEHSPRRTENFGTRMADTMNGIVNGIFGGGSPEGSAPRPAASGEARPSASAETGEASRSKVAEGLGKLAVLMGMGPPGSKKS